MKSAWTEKEMEILKEAYPVKESKIDNRLFKRAKDVTLTSKRTKSK